MNHTKLVAYVLATIVMLAAFSSSVLAQSTISGQARDSSGAVIGGVTVEAASDALIEKSRTVTTNGEGRYAIVDVRPGTYTVTFTMQGFSTLKRQVDVPANVTVPVDGLMQIGTIGQTVEVQAQVATVDVENVAHPEVLTRNDIDALPTARNPQSMGSYVPGVRLNAPDVGGSQQIEQTYLIAHGNPAARDTYMLDGMMVNTTQFDGTIQIYVDNALIQEVTYQTSNISLEVTGGGVFANFVPKDGGNELHGNLFLGYIPSAFVGTNIDAALRARGLTGQSAVNKLQDFDGALGGPIKRDKLWFLLSGRKQLSFVQAANSFYLNGAPAIERSYMYNGALRLTYQINSKNKFAGMWTRDWKTKENDVVTGSGGYSDVNPLVASLERRPKMYYILQGRYTGTLTPKLVVQAGATLTKLDYNINYHTGVGQPPFTEAWAANAAELDLAKTQLSIAGFANTFAKYDRYVWNTTGAYVTGSHQIKFGIQDSFGPADTDAIANGDAYYFYFNGVPYAIDALNTPTYTNTSLKHDLGIYGMDTWHIKRLSVTGGLRYEYLSAQIDPQSAPAGRFVGPRNFGRIDCSTIKGLGCFSNFVPRIGFVYDVFGNHKTAVKAGWGKYNSPSTGGFLSNFNPMTSASETVTWVGAPTTACQSHDPVGCYPSGFRFNQGNVGPNPNPKFGQINDMSLDPDYHREYQFQYNVGVQHELRRGVTLNFSWNRTSDYQQTLVLNYAVPFSAWTPVQITNPLDGSPTTVYNLQPQYFGVTPALHETNAPQSLRANSYNGFETAVTARLPHGAFFMGGWTIDRTIDRSCDMNTSAIGAARNDPNTLRFCDWTGRLYQDLGKITGIPYRNEFKILGSVPIKWGIQVSASLYAAPVYGGGNAFVGVGALSTGTGGFKNVYWSISPTTRYPTDCNCPNPGALVDPGLTQGSETITLLPPGSRFTPRLNQLDIGVRKIFRVREKMSLIGEAQFFNVLNSNAVLTENQSLASTIKPFLPGGPGGTPTVVMNPREMRLNFQFKF